MRVQFKCECGAKLRSGLRHIGKRKPCPACKVLVRVPRPSKKVVLRSMLPVPHAMPSKNVREYERLITDIIEIGGSNARLCDMTGHFHLVPMWIDDAIRQLRNVSVFAEDSASSAIKSSPRAANFLLAAAAGSDYGGLRTHKAKVRSYRRWMKKQRDSESCPTTEHLRLLVLDAIHHLEDLLG